MRSRWRAGSASPTSLSTLRAGAWLMSRHSDELKSILKAQAGGALAFRALAKARGVEQWAKKLSKKYGSAGPGGIGSLNPKVMYVFDHRPEPDEFSELEAEHAPQDIYVYWYNQ